MKCKACPFNDGITEEATMGQNFGCLPTPQDMLNAARNGTVLSCHDNERIACRGLCESFPEAKTLPIKRYSGWYRNG